MPCNNKWRLMVQDIGMKIPDHELIAVSDKFTEQELDVLAIYHYDEFGLCFLTLMETEDDMPIHIHYNHVYEQDPTLWDAAGPTGSIGLRAITRNGDLTGWRYFEGFSDSEILATLESRRIDELYQMVREESELGLFD